MKSFAVVTVSLAILTTACGQNGEPQACKSFAPSMVDLLARSRDRHSDPDSEPEVYREAALRFSLPVVEKAPEAIRSSVSTLRRAFEQWRPSEDLSADPEVRAAAEQIDRWSRANCSPRRTVGIS